VRAPSAPVVGPGLVATLGKGECKGRLAGLRVGGETDDIAIDDDGARMQHLASEELQRLGEDCPAIGVDQQTERRSRLGKGKDASVRRHAKGPDLAQAHPVLVADGIEPRVRLPVGRVPDLRVRMVRVRLRNADSTRPDGQRQGGDHEASLPRLGTHGPEPIKAAIPGPVA
jgi:hypothetical protein